MALHNTRRNSGIKNRFFLYKSLNFLFIFLMAFNAIILQILSRPVSKPNMLLWSIALF